MPTWNPGIILNAKDAEVFAKVAEPFSSAFLCEALCVLCVSGAAFVED
jgi:hypothetical protein